MANKKGNTINLDTASRLDIICRRGDTFNLVLDFGKSMATSGWTMEVREHDTSTGPAFLSNFTFSVTDGAAPNSKLTIQAASSTMDVQSGLYVYDLQLNANSTVKTYLYGTFKINEDVTINA